MGRRPRTVVMVVIRIGRQRTWAAVLMASSLGMPCFLELADIIHQHDGVVDDDPGQDDQPDEHDHIDGHAEHQPDDHHPDDAQGMVNMMMKGFLKDSNWEAMTR